MKHQKFNRNWAKDVKNDISRLPDAIEFFTDELADFYKIVFDEGRVVDLLRFQAGYQARYKHLYFQLDYLVSMWERRVVTTRAKLIRDWDANPPTRLKWGTADVKQLVEEEPDLMAASEILDELVYLRNQYDGILDTIKTQGYSLKAISELITRGFGEEILG